MGHHKSAIVEFDPGKIRIPLDHHECDALDQRIRILLSSGRLNEQECGHLLKWRRDLRKVDFRIARRIFDKPLYDTDARPNLWDDHLRKIFCGLEDYHELEIWSGWVHRLREYVDRLEAKYFCTEDI